MNKHAQGPWHTVLSCVILTPLATTATSLTLRSLPLTYDSFVVPKLTALVVLTAVALGLWALVDGREIRWRRSAHTVVVFAGLTVLAAALGLDHAVAMFGRDAANGLLAYLGYLLAFFLVLQLVTGTPHVRALAWAIVGSGAAAALATLYQAVTMTPERVTELGLGDVGFLYGRGGALFGNPDFVGAFLVVPLILAAGLTIGGREPRERLAAAAGGISIAAALVVTQVRAGWIGALVGLLVLAVTQIAGAPAAVRRRWWLVAGGLLIAMALGAAIIGPGLLAERFSVGADQGLDAISSGRLSGWGDALAVIADRPALGTGPDSFTLGWYAQAEALADPLTGARSYFEDPHNVYLSVAATLGVPAALALVALLGLAIRSGLAALRATREHPEAHGLYAGWLAACAGLLVTCLFAVATIPTMLLLFVCAAVLLAPGTRGRELPAGGAAALRGTAVLVALVLLVAGTMPIRADWHLGQHMRTGSPDSLEQARAIAPWEKTIQLRYLAVRKAQVVPLLEAAGAPAIEAVTTYDTDAFAIVDAHPHELLYTIERLELLGQAAGMLGPAIGEKNLVVANLAAADYPKLMDAAVYKARALNNLDRYDEAVAVLEPLPESVVRDAALAESYLLSGDEDAARALARAMTERYEGSTYAEAFLSQPTIAELLGE